MSIIKKILKANKKFLFSKSVVVGDARIENDVKIHNSVINVSPGSTLIIGSGCVLENVRISVKGTLIIGKGNFINNAGAFKKLLVVVDNGTLEIGDMNRLQCEMKVRFGGVLKIGNNNNINEDSEVRADENVTIGDFNQVSYRCVIWDTNTHNIYSDEKRRELTIKHYPKFGFEFEKPKTAKVFIGSDCWIGREVAILKGVTINNSCIIGYRTVVSNCSVEEGSTVVTDFNNKIFKRKTV